MPELPEVENLRLGLESKILGQKILKVIVNKPKLVSDKSTKRVASKKKTTEFINGLTNEKFLAVERRAKNLIFKLSHDKIILVHLKMTGQFVYLPSHKATARQVNQNIKTTAKNYSAGKIQGGHPILISETELPNKHTHIIFHLEKGTLYYNDTRMFGYVLYYPNQKEFDKENHFQKLGREPVEKDFNYEYFSQKLKNKKGKIKAVLLNQDIVTGVGNIYADESLFESGIRPDRLANTLKIDEISKLHNAITRIIKKAISVGGSSVATYRLLDESQGNYAREHKVYGKVGKKCVNCQNTLHKIIIQSRTTIFCKNCQK
jgi:formamidopyrimidine-DNA glycosylase